MYSLSSRTANQQRDGRKPTLVVQPTPYVEESSSEDENERDVSLQRRWLDRRLSSSEDEDEEDEPCLDWDSMLDDDLKAETRNEEITMLKKM